MTEMIKRIHAIFLNGCKQYKWLCIGWSFLLLSALPPRMFMLRTLGSQGFGEEMIRYAENIQFFENPLLIMYLLIAPLISVLIIFSHLHQKNRVDLMHQLPVTRLDLMLGRGLIAFCSVWVPFIVTGIIVYLLQGLTPEFQSVLEWKSLLQWLIHGSIFLFLHTMITIFIGLLTGMIATHGLFAVIAYLFPLGVYVMVLGNLSLLVQSYFFSFNLTDRFSWWLPIVRVSLADGFPLIQDFLYLVAGILFFIGAYQLYRVRPLETAGNVIAFAKLNRIFKYGMGFSFLLLLGPFFYLLANEIPSWLYIGYALGGLFGFFLAEVLIQKSFHVWSKWKSFLAFVCISGILIIGMRMDLLGIQKWQPQADSIQELAVTSHNQYYFSNDDDEYETISASIKKKTLELQKAMIQANLPLETPNTETIYCSYRLENHAVSKRIYTLNDNFLNSTYRSYLADPEILNLNFPILAMDSERIATLQLSSSLLPGRVISLTSPSEIRLLIEAIQSDVLHLQGGTYWNYLPKDERNTEFAYVQLLDQDGKRLINMAIRNQFEETTDQLTAMGRMDRLILTLDDVESVHLTSTTNRNDNRVIDDPKVIQELLTFINQTGDRYWKNTDYELTIYFTDRTLNNLYYQIDTNELPRTLRY
jgi:ABC-2 type transport system permease protein